MSARCLGLSLHGDWYLFASIFDNTYILFHILLPSPHGRLSYLKPHLRSRIVDKVEAGPEPSTPSPACSCGRRLIWIAIVVHLGLGRALLRDGRRRGSHHGDLGDMLRSRVKEFGGLLRWRVRLALHIGMADVRVYGVSCVERLSKSLAFK